MIIATEELKLCVMADDDSVDVGFTMYLPVFFKWESNKNALFWLCTFKRLATKNTFSALTP